MSLRRRSQRRRQSKQAKAPETNESPDSSPTDDVAVAIAAARSDNPEFFTPEERIAVEALVPDPNAKPGYELLRGCLYWADEIPKCDASEPLFWKIVLLQSYRSMMWRPEEYAQSKMPHIREWFEAGQSAWKKAHASQLQWIGFLPARIDQKNLNTLIEFASAEFDDF